MERNIDVKFIKLSQLFFFFFVVVFFAIRNETDRHGELNISNHLPTRQYFSCFIIMCNQDMRIQFVRLRIPAR